MASFVQLLPLRFGPSPPQPDPKIKWDALYDLKGTADDKTLIIDGERVPEARHQPPRLSLRSSRARATHAPFSVPPLGHPVCSDASAPPGSRGIAPAASRPPQFHKRCWHVRMMVCEATCDATIPPERIQYREVRLEQRSWAQQRAGTSASGALTGPLNACSMHCSPLAALSHCHAAI